jgi:hypothetical protein
VTWKVAIVGPAGEIYTDTSAFKLLYSFPTREAAEEHAGFFRFVETKIIQCDERGAPS